MVITSQVGSIEKVPADAVVLGIYQNTKRLTGAAASDDRAAGRAISACLSTKDFTGKKNQVVVLYPKDDDRVFSPAAYLPSPDSDPAVLVEKVDFHDDATARMREALTTLDDRSRHILESRWLTEDKQTLHQLGDIYSVSAERIRQIESNAIKKLKKQMAA